ncbi:MAG: glycosyltransferase family 4 protein [Thermoanaerobaculia bacterium]
MHVVFINRYFHPDHSATSQMLSDLAFHLAGAGWDVEVITSRQRYDDARATLPVRERIRGVRVHRVWSTRFGRNFLPGRAIDYLTFYAAAFLGLLAALTKSSVAVALTDPPLISVVAAVATRLRRATLINWTQDLFPEVATAMGLRAPWPLRPLRDWSLRLARTNVVLGERMAERVRRIPVSQVTVQPNWAHGDLQPIPSDRNALRAQWFPSHPFVVSYSGNLGRAHEVATLVGAIHELREDRHIAFLFVGGGARLPAIRNAGGNVRFEPYQPMERLSESLSSADVHLVTLRSEMEGLIVPSKIYGILAVGRPILFVGATDGEIARLIETTGCGAVVAEGDVSGLASRIRAMAADRAEMTAMGERGRREYERRFASEVALRNWEILLRG